MFSSGTGPAPNPGRAIALHLLRNCVSHMSGRMPAAFCVYPTVHIKSERKCICLYTQNVLLALLYIQNHSALPIFPLPAAMCTHMHMHFISKKCTPYHTYQFAGSSQEKKTKHSFAGRLSAATTLRGAHCGVQVHTICQPYTALPRPGSACRPHSPAVAPTKTKKDVKILATRDV